MLKRAFASLVLALVCLGSLSSCAIVYKASEIDSGHMTTEIGLLGAPGATGVANGPAGLLPLYRSRIPVPADCAAD
jgi:hypothetical protein